MIVYEDENFRLECNEFNNEHFLHCIVTNWKLSSFKKGLNVFGELLNMKTKEGVNRLVTVTPNPRFAKLLGGSFIGKVDKDGESYEVYQWVLKSL